MSKIIEFTTKTYGDVNMDYYVKHINNYTMIEPVLRKRGTDRIPETGTQSEVSEPLTNHPWSTFDP